MPFEAPEGITFVDIDPDTGKLAAPACPRVIREAFLAGTEPTAGLRAAPVLSWQERQAGQDAKRHPILHPPAPACRPAPPALPLRPRIMQEMNQEVFAAVADALERGEPAALVTIVSTTGSTPQRVGAKMLVFGDGRMVGTIGGGCYENDAFWKAREAITNRRPQLVHYELSDDFAQETGLICGGQMDVYIEPIEPSPELYVVGAGHVGFHLARLAHEVGFRVHVVDDREKFANRERFPNAAEVVAEDIPAWIARTTLPRTRTSSS